MAAEAYFSPALFKFLRALKRNNNREWFHAHKASFESDVREPMLAFISAFGPRLHKISRHYVADPRKSGGSMFRLHRDTRFAKDKAPYKTNVGAHFRHEAGRDAHAPGFYLHLEPGSVFIASGVWHPDGEALAQLRAAIADNPRAWRRASQCAGLRAHGGLKGESLKRPPRGYDAGHPLIEDLKRKEFFGVAQLDQAAAQSAGFLSEFTRICRGFSPLTRFLTEALELPW